MPSERIRFYQTGSFAAGNRLLPEDLRSVQSSATRSNTLTCGHRACRGCGEALGARYALDAAMRAAKGKATRAMDFHGARYLHVLVPCPLGWGSSPADTIKVARLAAESGLFPVFEAEAGEVTSSAKIRHQVPVTDYLRLQARYAHLFRPEERTDVIERLQASADRNIARFALLGDQQTSHPERFRLTPAPHHYSPEEG
jgi:pyruvate/2-oxoacid:ferredoxin oxidoreductase beta subunit